MNALVPVPSTNADAYRASTDAAGLCKEIVVASAMEIQKRRYVRVEGWQAIAIAHGCTGSARDVERVEGGVRAIGEVRRMSDGVVIAEAEGFVGEDEATWFGGEVETKWGKKTLPKRPDYAIRAMAQTRAISRACRSAFAHVVVMMNAGLSTTPAEEVPLEGFGDHHHDAPRPRQQPAAEPAQDAEFQPVTGKRKSSAQAKRDEDHIRINKDIDTASRERVQEWIENFDAYTAELPLSWLDALRDRLELRLEELNGAENVAAEDASLDEAFRATVGPAGRAPVSRRDAEDQGSRHPIHDTVAGRGGDRIDARTAALIGDADAA